MTPSPSARILATLSTLATILSLVACSRHDPPTIHPPAPAKPAMAVTPPPTPADPAIEAKALDKPHTAELMQAIFGPDYRANDATALVAIEDGNEAGYWRMSLRAARELPDGRTVVVVNGAPSDENGADATAHAAPGMLSVYTLRPQDGTWQALDRYQDVATLGSSGDIGTVQWLMLGADKPAIVVSSGGTWFGNTMANAQVFDLDHGMRSLGGFAELSSNEGGCMPDTDDCWDVHGKIGAQPGARPDDYRDIVVDFEGRHFRVTEDSQGHLVEHPASTVRQSARYRFNGKEYLLISGANPVPGIDG